MNKQKGNSKKSSFWDRATGKIAKITASITLLTGLIAALIGGFDTITDLLKKLDIVKEEQKKTENKSTSSICLFDTQMVEAEIIKVLPYSLKNTLDLQDPYWFRITVDNKKKEPVYLKGIFRVFKGPASIAMEQEQQEIGRFSPGKKGSVKLDLPLEFLINDDFEEPVALDIGWRIEDDKACQIDSGRGKVIVLPKNMFAWDFMTPGEGETVSEEFLLASLTAWIQKPAPIVKEQALDLIKDIEGNDLERQWLKQCYDLLGTKQFISTMESFPPAKGKRQAILTPSQILEGARPYPLEAALLIGALTKAVANQIRVRLILFIPDRQKPNFLLAWQDSYGWHALDVALASSKSFEENESQTSSQLNKLLTEYSDILDDDQMKVRGVFLKPDYATVALDFVRAANYFFIRSLP